ncbi:putative toxin-antitoxin system antitoxin component, TIGR02293 family [Ekhidna lutea]|uniref:Putative toxin-antitoxin system antitoxin component, TIGR02293 family n=1 Tax=Ekhidna lutea TaxID=447679 RepID=A0A239L6L6_EKHLU|nr:antitoxin Xre/MbcA/ParS toxin-binding domain-containing protein [Ekhidna lutea]SNT26237.1 putative toxin-antitoxin system antitoxin component, TIGR02293 family [Ekhidna lutea]
MKFYKIKEAKSDEVKEAVAAYGFTKDDMAGILGVSEKTYYNMMQKPTLGQEKSDRFHFIQQIFESGEEALGSKNSLSNWLKTPQPMLDGYVPLDMMRTITGSNRVLQILGRIKHGITA